MFIFKSGDKVYYPTVSTRIHTVDKFHEEKIIVAGRVLYSVGYEYMKDVRPSIFLATDDTHRSLEQLYGVPFEYQKSDKEVVKEYLSQGKKVLCYVSVYNTHPLDSSHLITIITDYNPHRGFKSSDGSYWVSVKPVGSELEFEVE